MTLPRVANDTDFIAEPHVLVDRDGEQLCAIVKATFEYAPQVSSQAARARGDGSFQIAPKDRRRKVRVADVPWGKPEISSILYPSDLCVRKPGTDVIVVGRAHAPGGRPAPTFDASIRLGRLFKTVRITGPRVFRDDGRGVGAPQPIGSLELRYEHAFGGTQLDPPPMIEDARNPVGHGFTKDPARVAGRPAPQIEDPAEPIGDPLALPRPAGLGPLGRHWEPRRKLWGTYDAAWVEKRSPLPPRDFDDRATCFAPRELIATPPLVGGEPGVLTNLTRGGGIVELVLPRLRLEIVFRRNGVEPASFTPPIDTVVFDTLAIVPREHKVGATAAAASFTVELVYRASVAAPARWQNGEIIVREARG